MIATLGKQVNRIDAATYGNAYRKVDRRSDRERQIDLIQDVGRSLDRLARRPFISTSLALMRKPASLAGLTELQSFLERGYAAFRQMGSADEFLALVIGRERQLMDTLLAGDDSLLEE